MNRLGPLIALLALALAGATVVGAAPWGEKRLVPVRNGWIAFERRGDIYLVAPGGQKARALTRNKLAEGGPTWSFDGRRLAFGRSSRPEEECKGCGTDLFVMKPDGTGVTRLSRNPQDVFYGSPAWSPNGRQLAFTRGTLTTVDLFLMAADGRRVHRLVAHAQDPDWSPNGKQIAFASEAASRGVFLISPQGGPVTRLSNQQWAQSPAWAPDGRRIAFLARSGVYVVQVQTRTEKKIAPRLCLGGTDWSPDGRWIVVGGCQGRRGVYRLRTDGTGWKRLWREGSSPSWRPLRSPR